MAVTVERVEVVEEAEVRGGGGTMAIAIEVLLEVGIPVEAVEVRGGGGMRATGIEDPVGRTIVEAVEVREEGEGAGRKVRPSVG